ncbi:MAG: GTP-binding protein, partial [Eubacteriales bacterium]|nr:GTP-binding protein [Eubacteriales bacterium]
HDHEHHHDHDGHCCHDHEHEEHEHDHDHEHHHDHDGHCCHDHDHEEHEHHHDHDHGEHAHHHDHEHHHHHHADEVFTSWGVETAKKFEKSAVEAALHELDTGKYGLVLRAKGILPAADGSWIHFDYVPEESDVRSGSADVTGKLCVIGSKLDEKGVAALFGV